MGTEAKVDIPATVERAYKTYANAQAKIGETAISLEAYAAKFAGVQVAKEVANQIDLNTDQLATLMAAGWSIIEYTPKGSGTFSGRKGEYLKNDEATVNGAGFMRLNKDRLEKTRERLQRNLDAINVVLGDQTA